MSNASLELGGDNWAAKDGNLLGYAVGDSSGKYVPREFTFTRGSNLAATRVAANGLIEKGRENLLLQSNQFDTTWVSVTASVTSGQSGYDGSNDAWLLSKSAASGRIYQNASVSGVATYSVYAKSNDLDWLFIIGTPSSYPEAYFNLSNGTIGNTSNHQNFIGANIEDVGNGWYRCSITFNDSLGQFRIYPADGNNDFSGTSGSIYIQDAQLEQGLVATGYIETGASTVQAGLLEHEPRIDYTGGTGSLLLEPNRTNLVTQSEYFGDWNEIQNATTELASVISPEGKLNAYEFTFDGTSNGRIEDSISVTSGNTYTFSVYLKNKNISTPTQIWIGFSAPPNQGEYVTVTDEWQRFETTQVADGSTEYPRILCNGVGSIYGYGAQLEEGSYKTSYIPNHSGGSVTRGADDLNDFDISSMLTSSSFTWFLDLNDYIGSDLNQETIFLESSPNLKIQLRVRPDGYRFYYNNIAGGSAYPIAGSKTANKFCVSYDGSNYRLYIDGILEATTASVGDSGWDFIKNATGASLPLKQMLLFPTALSDAQCSALTVEGLKEEILTSYIAAVDTLEDGAEARLDTYLQNLEELIV